MQFWNSTTEAATTIFMGIIAVAILAILVSKKAQTPQVIQAIASGFSNSLAVAQSPVTGNAVDINTSYPSSGGFAQDGLFGTNNGVGMPYSA
jgi:hypothetical protein